MLTFGIGAALAGLAGALLTPIYTLSPQIGGNFILAAFAVVVLGGLGSVWGAFIGGFVVGLVEAFAGYYFDPALKHADLVPDLHRRADRAAGRPASASSGQRRWVSVSRTEHPALRRPGRGGAGSPRSAPSSCASPSSRWCARRRPLPLPRRPASCLNIVAYTFLFAGLAVELEHHRRLRRPVLPRSRRVLRRRRLHHRQPLLPLAGLALALADPGGDPRQPRRGRRLLADLPPRGPFFAIATLALQRGGLRAGQLLRPRHRRSARHDAALQGRLLEHGLHQPAELRDHHVRLPGGLPGGQRPRAARAASATTCRPSTSTRTPPAPSASTRSASS